MLERVRLIRASERSIGQQITDIFAECNIDYDRDSAVTYDFYAMVQNKFHYAITGQTAAEIIHAKAGRRKDNIGLATWKNAPGGQILKSDVDTFTMGEFSASANEFLIFRKYEILPGKEKVSKQMAAEKAKCECAQFNKMQQITSDFDREVKRLMEKQRAVKDPCKCPENGIIMVVLYLIERFLLIAVFILALSECGLICNIRPAAERFNRTID